MTPSRATWVLLMLLLSSCSSSLPEATTLPTAEPTLSPSGNDVASSSPTLVDKSCNDFASASQAQDFYLEAGGPDQDLHGLDPDRNGKACEDLPAATAAAAPGGGTQTAVQQPAAAQSPAVAQQPRTAPATPGPPQSVHSSSGAAAGKSGGSSEQSSCKSSDETGCD